MTGGGFVNRGVGRGDSEFGRRIYQQGVASDVYCASPSVINGAVDFNVFRFSI